MAAESLQTHLDAHAALLLHAQAGYCRAVDITLDTGEPLIDDKGHTVVSVSLLQ